MSRKMKDSGIEWIGEIPEEWEIKRIKYMFNVVSGSTPKSDYFDYWDGDVIWITPADYKTLDKHIENGSRNISKLGLRSCSTTLVPQESIIFSKRAPIGTVAIAAVNLCTNQGCLSCIPQQEVYSLFYYYVMSIATEDFELKGSGTTFKEISTTAFNDSQLPFSPLSEQQKIALFLDKKCSEIDSLTADIQKQIEILEQYKKSVITETVTKGLDPNVKMKDSGIEWIGEIPEEWEVISCKFCFTIYNGSDPTTKYGDTPVYGSGSKSFKTCEEYKDGPTVLLGRKGTVNIPQWIEGKYWNVDTAFDVKPKGNYNLRLFFYVAICFDYEKYSTQTALPSMTQTDYNGFKLPYMSIEEQQHIASYLDSKCSRLDELIRLKNQQLETLAQYKKSLIYEYVTGKREAI